MQQLGAGKQAFHELTFSDIHHDDFQRPPAYQGHVGQLTGFFCRRGPGCRCRAPSPAFPRRGNRPGSRWSGVHLRADDDQGDADEDEHRQRHAEVDRTQAESEQKDGAGLIRALPQVGGRKAPFLLGARPASASAMDLGRLLNFRLLHPQPRRQKRCDDGEPAPAQPLFHHPSGTGEHRVGAGAPLRADPTLSLKKRQF
jgi:hypothetical protein